ncbi:hypothetical protein [Actinomadura rugatobispora]|uniref:Helix-turn-helix domain-containing protein n=1 Tax=Actinomadura rugatobispora TaxID=1994 RepID=A0ABW0ZQH6_9ACTN|nr:hypothetical protein GCM10010200_035990 [Actinomadura rugatobispora]
MSKRQLQPCGTHAAYVRHKYRGEPIDDACEAAHRAYCAAWARKARDRYPTATCTACERERLILRYGWCQSCVSRWQQAGRPDTGPPPLRRMTSTRAVELREDFTWLLETGESVEMAAERLGIAAGTARDWHQRWRKEAAA